MAAALCATAALLSTDPPASGTEAEAAAVRGPSMPSPRDFAYGVFLNKQGRWIGPRRPSNEPALGVIDDLIDARPRYLRLTTASNECPVRAVKPSDCKTGLPVKALTETPRFQELMDSGIRLGVGINAAFDTQEHDEPTRPVREVIQHACEIKARDDAGVYDFIFLDFSLKRRNNDELQRIVDAIRTGRECPPESSEGWGLVMTSDTTFRSAVATESSRRAWAHGKRFELLEGSKWRERVRKAVRGRRSPLVREDRRFIDYIERRDPKSHPMLELEVAHQTTRFSRLDRGVQRKLLELWAKAQEKHDFDMVYPLYVHGHGDGLHAYDSRAEGTYGLQRKLMCRYGGRRVFGC